VVGLLLVLAGCSGGGSSGPDPDARAGRTERAGRDSATAARAEAPRGVHLAGGMAEGEEERNTSLRLLVRLVDATPAGARIRVVQHSFSFLPAAEALVRAHDRGVAVQVLMDRSVSGTFDAPALLRRELGRDRSADSFAYLAPGEQHQKSITFTHTGASRDVSWVGSLNLTYVSARQYTDTITWVDRPDVRRLLDRRFVQLVTRLPDVGPLEPGQGGTEETVAPIRLGRDTFFFYPGTNDPDRVEDADDPVLDALDDLADGGADGARVQVAMYAWLDDRGAVLAQRLGDLVAAGADVTVVAGPSVAGRQVDILRAGGVEVVPGSFAGGDEIHHKLTVVSHPGTDRPGFVLTGSDNFTAGSLVRPELLLRRDLPADSQDLRRYRRWLDALVARGERAS